MAAKRGSTTKPVFVPLRTEHFRAFERGEKSIEYRRHGRQWTKTHCHVGRDVILSHGYSGARLKARITRFTVRTMDSEIYGKRARLACIHVEILPNSLSA